jgi:hypothetical protein
MYTVRLRGLPGAQDYLKGVRTRLQDLRPAWREINKALTIFFKLQFETEGRAGGQPWAPRTSATQVLLNRKGVVQTKILHERGTLERSLTSPSASKDAIRVINRRTLHWGSKATGRKGFATVIAAQEGFTSKFKPIINPDKRLFFVRRTTPVRIAPRVLLPDPLPKFLENDWVDIVIRHLERRTR